MKGYSQFIFVFTKELEVKLGLLTLTLKKFYLLLKPAVLVLQILLLQGQIIIVLFKYLELLDLAVIFLAFKGPPLPFLAHAH